MKTCIRELTCLQEKSPEICGNCPNFIDVNDVHCIIHEEIHILVPKREVTDWVKPFMDNLNDVLNSWDF